MRFKCGVEDNEGQDTAGAERPSGVQKQSSDLNLGLRAGIRLPVGPLGLREGDVTRSQDSGDAV